MTYLPCADPVNDPEDWFLEKDGSQYSWEPLVTDDLWEMIQHAADQDDVHPPTREEAEERAKAFGVRRRRHARDLCHTVCERRLACLGDALDGAGGTEHGIRGGYFPEQLRKLEQERAKRGRRDIPG